MKCWNCGVEYKLSLRIITRPRISSWFSGRLATSSDCVSAISPDMPPHQHIINTIHKVVDDGGSKQRPLGAVHLGPFQSPNSHSPISKKFPDPAGPFPYLQMQFDFYNLKYHPSSFWNLPNLQPNDNSSLSWTHCQIEATFPSHFNNFMEAH